MQEVQVTMKGLVESRTQFRQSGANEEQLERFGELSDFGKIVAAGLIRRGMSEGPEEALTAVEKIERNRG